MDFNVKKNPLIEKQEKEFKNSEVDIAYKFSKLIIEELQDFVKAIVLFGSTARKSNTKGDIDILIIVDDIMVQFDKAIVQGYRVLTQAIVQKVSDKLHITTMRITNFWEYIRAGDPIAINILREGIAIRDTGIFNPLKVLLYQGRIKPSKESINNYISRGNYSINSSKSHILAACVDLYWAVIDSAEAALMKVNEIPPGPSHVHAMIEKIFIQKGVIEKKYSIILQEFYHLNKSIEHKEITYIPGEQFSKYLHEAQDFVECMQKIVKDNK